MFGLGRKKKVDMSPQDRARRVRTTLSDVKGGNTLSDKDKEMLASIVGGMSIAEARECYSKGDEDDA